METTRLSTKGQVILPQAIRLARAWVPGTEFIVEETPDGVLLRPAARFPESRLEDVAGCLRPERKLKSAVRMRTAVGSAVGSAIASEVSRRHDRGRY